MQKPAACRNPHEEVSHPRSFTRGSAGSSPHQQAGKDEDEIRAGEKAGEQRQPDGGAKREAIELLRAHGANPVGILIAFDRMEKGRGEQSAIAELKREFGLPVIAIATLDDLMVFIRSRPELAGVVGTVTSYRQQYGAT